MPPKKYIIIRAKQSTYVARLDDKDEYWLITQRIPLHLATNIMKELSKDA